MWRPGWRSSLPSDDCTTVRVFRDEEKDKRRGSRQLRSELKGCVKVEVAVLGSLSLIVRTVSVDLKQH